LILIAAQLFLPGGVTPVTVTATDKDGNTTNCVFTVTVLDNTSPKVPQLPVLTGEASVQVPVPVAIDICGTVTNQITGTTTDPTSYNTQGTFVVHWKFDDGNGNIVVSNQTVIVDDVTAPAAPALADVTGECMVTVTPPKAPDNVVGMVVGTTSDPLTTLRREQTSSRGPSMTAMATQVPPPSGSSSKTSRLQPSQRSQASLTTDATVTWP
jgi:hypothetical protein